MDIPQANNENQSEKEKALNKKGTPADGVEVSQQIKDKRQHNQPRDNA